MNLFELLNKDEIKLGTTINIKKGNFIFHEEDKCDSVFFLLNGEVIISSFDTNGNEEIYNHLYKDSMFGNILVFSDNNYYLGNAFALKDSRLFVLKKDNLIKIMHKNKEFMVQYLRYNSNETISSKIKVKILSKRNIKERILYYILLNKGCVKCSITNLSKELVLNRVCVSRVINELIKDNILVKENGLLKLI